jgi:hypothetical protein
VGEPALAGVMAQLTVDEGGEAVSEVVLGEMPLCGVGT